MKFAMFVVKTLEIEKYLLTILKLMETKNILVFIVTKHSPKGHPSEEVVEATHSKFETFWKRYKALDVESDQHGQSLLECLLDFNTKNI